MRSNPPRRRVKPRPPSGAPNLLRKVRRVTRMAKILLAEDDETMVGLLTTLLRMDGYEVTALDADDDVAAVVQLDCPDALVLDVHLAGQNGFDVLDSIRRADGKHRVRVIMISGLNVREESMRH